MGNLSVLLMFIAGILFAGMAVGVGKLVSTKIKNPVKSEAYECGMQTEGITWGQFNVGYYLFSLIFLIFDVEVVFFYPWAVSLKEIGVSSLVEIIMFMLFLFIGLLYAFKKKALKWN